MGSKRSNSDPAGSSKCTGSSNRRRTCSGASAKTSPPAGSDSTSFAWAHAGPAMAIDKQVTRSSPTEADGTLISTLPSENRPYPMGSTARHASCHPANYDASPEGLFTQLLVSRVLGSPAHSKKPKPIQVSALPLSDNP